MWHPLLSCGLILLVNAYAPLIVAAFSNRVSVLVWTCEKDLKMLCVKKRKKLSFQTKTVTCGRSLRLQSLAELPVW